ncbi:hypothetical protein [Micromonospora globbae]|uniref:hypothetical protein n=1 Tax=Micromonospora globbae TaxID=1894969 RepID=UPI0034384649
MIPPFEHGDTALKRLDVGPLDPGRCLQSGFICPWTRKLNKITWQPAKPSSCRPAISAAIGAPRAVEAEVGVCGGAEYVAERGAAFPAGPAVFSTFEFANPAVINVVGGEAPTGVEAIEGGVDGVG